MLWYGDLLIVEKIGGSADTIWLPGDVCKPNSTNGSPGVAPCTSRGSYFRIRQQALLGHGSNDPVDTGGGVNIIPGSQYKSFASAFVDDTSDPARPTLWVFGTSDCVGWNKPTGCAFNTSAPDHPWIPCNCPGGTVARGEVWAMWSSDPLLSKSSWRYKKVLSLPPEIGVCNTDVTRGPGGEHVMVLEQMVYMDGNCNETLRFVLNIERTQKCFRGMNVRSTVSILAIVSTELSIKIANGVDAGGQGYRNLFAQTGMRTDKSYTNFQTKARKHNAGRFTETNSSPPAAANSLTRVRFIRRKRSL